MTFIRDANILGLSSVVRSSGGGRQCDPCPGTELAKRYAALLEGDEGILDTSDLLLMVIDNADAVKAISDDPAGKAAYENIVKRYKNLNVAIAVVGMENMTVPYGSPDMLRYIKDHRHLFFFDDLANLKVFDLPVALTRRYKKKIEIGECYYLNEHECYKLKTPLFENSEGTYEKKIDLNRF